MKNTTNEQTKYKLGEKTGQYKLQNIKEFNIILTHAKGLWYLVVYEDLGCSNSFLICVKINRLPCRCCNLTRVIDT